MSEQPMNDRKFDRTADYFAVFPMPAGIYGLAIGFWDYGEYSTMPTRIEKTNMRRVVNKLQRKGYTAFQNTDHSFEAYVVVNNGVDIERARTAAKNFMLELAVKLVDEFGGKHHEV